MNGRSIAHYQITAKLGQKEATAKVVEELLAARPDFPRVGLTEMGKWFSPELLDQIVDGLRKAGLEMDAPSKP
jgi:hypothetical protein